MGETPSSQVRAPDVVRDVGFHREQLIADERHVQYGECGDDPLARGSSSAALIGRGDSRFSFAKTLH